MKLRNDNKKYTEISLYVIVTVVIIYALSKVTDHAGTIVRYLGGWFQSVGAILTPLLAGFVIAYLLLPVVRFIQDRLAGIAFYKKRNKQPRGMAVAITLILAALILAVGCTVVISAVTHEISVVSLDSLTETINAMALSLEGVYTDLQNLLEQWNISSAELREVADNLTSQLGNYAKNLGTAIMGSASNLTGFLTSAVFAIILGIYFMIDADNLMTYWDRVLKAIVPKKAYEHFHIGIKDADFVFSGYIRGQLIDAVLMAIMISVALSLIGVKFGVIIGVLAGIGNLIPYVGPIIAYGLTIVVTLLELDIRKLIVALIVLFVIQTVDGNIINPRLMSSNTNVHPMLVIVALLFGSAVGGIFGMLLAVPVAALLKIWFDRLIQQLIKKRKIEADQ